MADESQRKKLTLEDRLDILQAFKSKTHTPKQLEKIYNVSKHTINQILINEDQLLGVDVNSKGKRKRRPRGTNRLVDDAVSKWYHAMVERNVVVNGPLLRQQAVRFARMMNNNSFQANNGWLWRWQRKENVRFNISRREATIEKAIREKEELSRNISLQGFEEFIPSEAWQSLSANDSNTSETWHQQVETDVKQELQDDDEAELLGEEEAEHEPDVEGEIDDLLRNPFEADVVFDVEDEEQDNSYNENSSNINYHLGLNVDGDEMRATLTMKCFVCQKSGEVVPFSEETFNKCLNSIKFRHMKNLKHGELILNLESKYNLGYHKHCYESVISMRKKWKEEYDQMLLQGGEEISIDQEISLESNNSQLKSFDIKEEPNNYSTNNFKIESGKYILPNRRKKLNEEDDRDIFSVYGDYVASRLRESSNQRENYEIYIAQHTIDDVLFKLSMGCYARSTSKCVDHSKTEKSTEEIKAITENKNEKTQHSIKKEDSVSLTASSEDEANTLQNSCLKSSALEKVFPAIDLDHCNKNKCRK